MRSTAQWLGTLCPGASLSHGDHETVLRRGAVTVTLRTIPPSAVEEPFEAFVGRLADAIQAHDPDAPRRAIDATLRHARSELGDAQLLARSAAVLVLRTAEAGSAFSVPGLVVAWLGVEDTEQRATWELIMSNEDIHMRLSLEEADAVAATLDTPDR